MEWHAEKQGRISSYCPLSQICWGWNKLLRAYSVQHSYIERHAHWDVMARSFSGCCRQWLSFAQYKGFLESGVSHSQTYSPVEICGYVFEMALCKRATCHKREWQFLGLWRIAFPVWRGRGPKSMQLDRMSERARGGQSISLVAWWEYCDETWSDPSFRPRHWLLRERICESKQKRYLMVKKWYGSQLRVGKL